MGLVKIQTCELKEFLVFWQEKYESELYNIAISIPFLTTKWNDKQKEYFVKTFYHLRGHFHEFLWYVGNHAPDRETKNIILENISEEFNGSALSHEQIYIEFARSLNVDLSEELVNGETYLPFIKDFNQGHLRWLASHSAEERFAAFSAYELLDNIDYKFLLRLADSLKVGNKGKLFFKIHVKAAHFGTTEEYIKNIWETSPEKVENAFNFIAEHQLNMWTQLSNSVFSYGI